jgi:hypothetical protein
VCKSLRISPDPRNHARGLPIQALQRSALAAAQVAVGISEERLTSFVVEACALVEEPEVDALSGALVRRCRNAPALVLSYLQRLGALT